MYTRTGERVRTIGIGPFTRHLPGRPLERRDGLARLAHNGLRGGAASNGGKHKDEHGNDNREAGAVVHRDSITRDLMVSVTYSPTRPPSFSKGARAVITAVMTSPLCRPARNATASGSLDIRSGGRQDLAREGVQCRQAEGLGQHRHRSLSEETLVIRVFDGAGDQDYAPQEIRLPPLQLLTEADPVEFWHAEIAEDEVVGSIVDLFKCMLTVDGHVDLI